MSNLTNDPFWFEDFSILFRTNRLTDFFPSNSMTMIEKLNAMARFCIYLGVLLYFYNQDYKTLFIVVMGLVLTYYLYMNIEKEEFTAYCNIQNDNKKDCIQPTKHNPLMNITIPEYGTEGRKKICSNNNDLIEQKFNINLYKDIGDVYENQNSQRQFYTTPITTIPNDQDGFAKWLYGPLNSCKDGNKQRCVDNISNRHILR
mgnify:CR=1 FL=1|tara:strand:- start:284 stop:889 length:606 start_codon:yes stop_codon:yes gene_type:complete